MPNRKMFPDSIIPVPASPGVTAHGLTVNAAESHHRADKMDISFSLSLPPALEKELEERVDKGDVISPDEMKTKYSVDAATANALQTWLKSEGFTITGVAPDRTTIYTSAPASQVEASLGVHMVRVTQEGVKPTRPPAMCRACQIQLPAAWCISAGCSPSGRRGSTCARISLCRPTRKVQSRRSPMHRPIWSPRSSRRTTIPG